MKILIILIIFFSNNAMAEDVGESTGKPIPRFISLKNSPANLRIGPNTDYPKILEYEYKNIPLKVVDEFDQWRKVIDWMNNEGWIHLSLLSSKRFGIIINQNNEYIDVYNKPGKRIKGKIGTLNIVELKKCIDKWCKIKIETHTGWIEKNNIWGVFKDEDFD